MLNQKVNEQKEPGIFSKAWGKVAEAWKELRRPKEKFSASFKVWTSKNCFDRNFSSLEKTKVYLIRLLNTGSDKEVVLAIVCFSSHRGQRNELYSAGEFLTFSNRDVKHMKK